MSRAIQIVVLLAIAAVLGGCAKEEIEVDQLSNNPFDADYAGPVIFSLIATRTVPYAIGPNNFIRLEIDVRVDASLFPVPTSYGILYKLPTGPTVEVNASESGDNEFTMIALDVAPATEYCFLPRLRNNGGTGGGNIICGTTE